MPSAEPQKALLFEGYGTCNVPTTLLHGTVLLLNEARNLGMDGFAFQKCEKQRASLMDHIGGCERILKTPLARSGAIQVRQFIFLLLVTLPFGLIQDFGTRGADSTPFAWNANQFWVIPLYVMLLAYPLLSLDRIGMELQNPFSPLRIDFLPLDILCTGLERNLLELLHDIEGIGTAAPRPAEVELPPAAKVPEHHERTIADIS